MMLPNTAIVEGRRNAKQAVLNKKCACWRRAHGRSYSRHDADLRKIMCKKARQTFLKIIRQVSRP